MESFRQMLNAVYFAATAAGGDDMRNRVNERLAEAVNTGVIDDPYARSAIMSILRIQLTAACGSHAFKKSIQRDRRLSVETLQLRECRRMCAASSEQTTAASGGHPA